jgi:hypothetical protein
VTWVKFQPTQLVMVVVNVKKLVCEHESMVVICAEAVTVFVTYVTVTVVDSGAVAAPPSTGTFGGSSVELYTVVRDEFEGPASRAYPTIPAAAMTPTIAAIPMGRIVDFLCAILFINNLSQ